MDDARFFRYESETILQKTFVKRSLFGMTSLIFLTEHPLFRAASQCYICLIAAATSSAVSLLLF